MTKLPLKLPMLFLFHLADPLRRELGPRPRVAFECAICSSARSSRRRDRLA